MSAELEDLLDRCLAKRAEGWATESPLAGVDEQARRELEPLVLLIDGLREAPRPALSAAASAFHEHRVLSDAAQLRAKQRTTRRQAAVHRPPSGWLSGWRFGFVPAATILVLLAAMVLFAGAGSMVANARSDDTFYNLKVSWEQARLLLSANDARRARVFVDLAQNRVAEMEALAAQGRPIPEELLSQVRSYVDEAIILSAGLSGREAISLLRSVAELLSYERMLLLQVLGTAPRDEQVVVERALESLEASQQAATQALQDRVEEQLPGIPVSSAPAPAPAEVEEPSREGPGLGPDPLFPSSILSENSAPTVRQVTPIEPSVDLEVGSTSDQTGGDGLGVGLQSLREGKRSPKGHDDGEPDGEHGRPTEPQTQNRGAGNSNKPSGQEHGQGGRSWDEAQPPPVKEAPARSKRADASERGTSPGNASKQSVDPVPNQGQGQGKAGSRTGGAGEGAHGTAGGESGGGGSPNSNGNRPTSNQAPGKPGIQPSLR